MVVVLLALFARAINGQSSCSTSRTAFGVSFSECLMAFEGAGVNASQGISVNNETIDLVCTNMTCQTAIANYIANCNGNDTLNNMVSRDSLSIICMWLHATRLEYACGCIRVTKIVNSS